MPRSLKGVNIGGGGASSEPFPGRIHLDPPVVNASRSGPPSPQNPAVLTGLTVLLSRAPFNGRGARREPPLDAFDISQISQAEILVAHALAPRQQTVRELLGRQMRCNA